MLKDVLEVLATTPEKLRKEISTLSRRGMRARPAPQKWSVREVVAHLDDVEEIGMRSRVAAMIEQDNPSLPPVDEKARAIEMHYEKKDPLRTLAHFATQRRGNVKWLRTLRPAQLKRKGHHQTIGEISVEELVTEWAFHDLGHIKQILEIKRYRLYPRIGNMRAFYKLS